VTFTSQALSLSEPGFIKAAIFALNTNDMDFTILHSVTGFSDSNNTNSDGAAPVGGLILSGNTLFGTASAGGSGANGTVFALNTDGTGFTNLYSFTLAAGSDYTNRDGATPADPLILSGNTLYGTAYYGGVSGNGAIFAIDTNGVGTGGVGFTNLYSFTATYGSDYTNTDGANPQAGLILSGDTLYGTTYYGGLTDSGTVFSLSLPAPPATGDHSLKRRCYFDVAGHCYWFHFTIHNEPCFTSSLVKWFSSVRYSQWPECGDQPHLRLANVLPLKPMTV
jgi:uncharacterized repeat protein (TIGR03803 family)